MTFVSQHRKLPIKTHFSTDFDARKKHFSTDFDAIKIHFSTDFHAIKIHFSTDFNAIKIHFSIHFFSNPLFLWRSFGNADGGASKDAVPSDGGDSLILG